MRVPVETGNVVGNVYDKYGTHNPVARVLMRRFLRSVLELYTLSRPRSVLEVGCGEGHLARHLFDHGPRPETFEISDVDVDRVRVDLPPAITVRQASIYDLPHPTDSFDLVVCCEVLEHLEHPVRGLAELARVARRRVLISTPWEPVWRILNMMRGKYLREFGNTPGHVQHFSRRDLLEVAAEHLRVLQRRTPLPWTILLGEPHP
jgi:ubiquinone/menaquinone biosynthesis C-methylase UbiE